MLRLAVVAILMSVGLAACGETRLERGASAPASAPRQVQPPVA